MANKVAWFHMLHFGARKILDNPVASDLHVCSLWKDAVFLRRSEMLVIWMLYLPSQCKNAPRLHHVPV